MRQAQEENGITQKLAILDGISKLVWEEKEPGDYGELYNILSELTGALQQIEGCLSSITNKIEALRRKDRVATWNSLGEFQGTPVLCDVYIGQATVYFKRLASLVADKKVPAASIPLIRQIIWIEDKA